MEKIVIIYGSKIDVEFAEPLRCLLEKFGISYEQRIVSAHKTPEKLLGILKELERSKDRIVYVTIAGRSNALSGFVDANTKRPVIACPPRSENFGGADIYSSLRMPSGVAPVVVLEPEAAALAAVKILAMGNEKLSGKVIKYQQKMKEKIEADDRSLNKNSSR